MNCTVRYVRSRMEVLISCVELGQLAAVGAGNDQVLINPGPRCSRIIPTLSTDATPPRNMTRRTSPFGALRHLASKLRGWLTRIASVRGRSTPEPETPAVTPAQSRSTSTPAPQAQSTAKRVRQRIETVGVDAVRKKTVIAPAAPKTAPAVPAPACPFCKKTMVTRLARTGKNAGGSFWGCADYPKCRGIRPVFAPMKIGGCRRQIRTQNPLLIAEAPA